MPLSQMILAMLTVVVALHQQAAAEEIRKLRLDLLGDPLPQEALARMGSGRLRHFGPGHRSILFSPDSKQLLSSGHEDLRIWDTATGKLQRRFDVALSHNGASCRFVGDSIVCASANVSGGKWAATVQVLDAATGQVRRRVRIEDQAFTINPPLSPDGKRLAVAIQNEIRLYDTATGKAVQSIPVQGGAAWSIAFAPDGKSLAFNDLSDTIYLHDTASGKLIRKLKQSGDTTLHVVFSPDGRFLASMPQSRLADKGQVSIWDVRKGKEVQLWTHPFSHAMSAAFSPDGKRVAIGGAPYGLVLRDVETGKEIRHLSPHGGIYQIAFSPDGKILATGSSLGAIRLWDTATGKLLPGSVDADVQAVYHLRFSGDGKRLYGASGVCLAWDVATGCEVLRFADPKPLDFKDPTYMHRLALSPDESLLAAAHPHEPIVLWEAARGKIKHTLKGDDSTLQLVFAPDGRRLISVGDKNSVHIWDSATGRELHRLPGGPAMAVSADGRLLAATDTSRRAVLVYDLTTGQETKRLSLAQAGMAGSVSLSHLVFAADGRSLAAVGSVRAQRAITGGAIKLWDLSGSERARSFDGGKMPIVGAAFSPDGRTLATGNMEGALIFWEVSSGRKRHTLAGHESRILALAFSPDGRSLAASSVDAPVYIWDVAGALQSNPRRLSDVALQRGWSDLANEDAAAAFQAIRRLAAAPEQTPAFLRQHLKPASAPDRKRIRQLVEMLDSAEFQMRQNAGEELEKQSDAAVVLREILTKEKPSLEVRRRLEQIVERIENNPESLRAIRAVEVLEWVATPEAMRLIGQLANGAAEARLTREASAAKRRLRH